jgi:murein DD-endopeptidase MepM/ murein hydrolase activator NlpD
MKLAVVFALPVLVAVTLIPAVLGGGDSAPFTGCGLYGGEVDTILATIRQLESGDDYTAQAAGSTASGAYQFINSTWDHYGGYARAADAPPEIQDAKAIEMVQQTLEAHESNVAAVPVVWYIGRVPAPSSPRWDQVPVPQAVNTLTPREYQARWIDTYQQLLAGPSGTVDGEAVPIEPGGCVGGAVEAIAGGWSLPGPRALIEADPRALDAPHHDYPAWDWIIPENTPIYAVRGGTVVSTKYWPFNWWSEGCGENGGGDCTTCGVGVTIKSDDGTRWTYCHGNNLTVADNAVVEAGQQIMWSGNTGRSGTAHLHLEIRVNGQQRCPQRLLGSLFNQGVAISPADLSTIGCSFAT